MKRKVKGRKGIGKFAGLSLANRMDVIAVARGRKCHLSIDNMALTENENDLESVLACHSRCSGTRSAFRERSLPRRRPARRLLRSSS
ncbi:ATP-binding protein, partial [Rhizobium ruizarguesonis]